MQNLHHVVNHSVMITLFVFVMMLLVDYINVLTRGKIEEVIKKKRVYQYIMASFLGATPGCLGAFMNVSFYVHGLLSFGAIVGGMIATCGDEAFVMLALFPQRATLLFGILFVLGIFGAFLSDKIASYFNISLSESCKMQVVHEEEITFVFYPVAIKEFFLKPSFVRYLTLFFLLFFLVSLGLGYIGPSEWTWMKITTFLLLFFATFIILTAPEHYLKVHIWRHLVKRHLWRVFLWTFFALLFINIGLGFFNIENFVRGNILWVFLVSALVGLIPESGPHMVFVMMFAEGLVPFSVLLTTSIVQDGHGMLPLFSCSVKDALRVKLFNFIFGIVVGAFFLLLGF